MLTVLQGDCRDVLKTLPDESVHCCVTSPPYFSLRDYGVVGQMGLEATPEEFVAELVGVFREVRRVLRSDGTLWLNLGDSYAGGGNYRGIHSEGTLSAKQRSNGGARGVSQLLGAKDTPGCKPKDMIGIPWAVAFALRADGWYLRSDIIWSKPNPMPESVTDRPTKAHEYLFLLAKSQTYFYDAAAIADSAVALKNRKGNGKILNGGEGRILGRATNPHCGLGEHWTPDGTRNRRTVWEVTTQPTPMAHFATFPEALVEPCVLAGCPVGGTVLDPFAGSGTVGRVALSKGRQAVLIELNRESRPVAPDWATDEGRANALQGQDTKRDVGGWRVGHPRRDPRTHCRQMGTLL